MMTEKTPEELDYIDFLSDEIQENMKELKQSYTTYPSFEHADLWAKNKLEAMVNDRVIQTQDKSEPDLYNIFGHNFKPSDIAGTLDETLNGEAFTNWMEAQIEDYNEDNEYALLNEFDLDHLTQEAILDELTDNPEHYKNSQGETLTELYHDFLDYIDHPDNAPEDKVLCYGVEHHPSDVLRYCFPEKLNEVMAELEEQQLQEVNQCINQHDFEGAKEAGSILQWKMRDPQTLQFDNTVEAINEHLGFLKQHQSDHPVVQEFNQKEANLLKEQNPVPESRGKKRKNKMM